MKQVRLEDMALTPNLTQSLNNLSTHAVMAQILDEIEYVGDAIREIHVELQNDRLAMSEGARDKLMQARLIQDAKLRAGFQRREGRQQEGHRCISSVGLYYKFRSD